MVPPGGSVCLDAPWTCQPSEPGASFTSRISSGALPRLRSVTAWVPPRRAMLTVCGSTSTRGCGPPISSCACARPVSAAAKRRDNESIRIFI